MLASLAATIWITGTHTADIMTVTQAPQPVADPWAIEGLSVRFSRKDKNTSDKPAQFTLLNPSSGDNTYSIDVGLTYDLGKGKNWSYDLSVFGEVHKNTNIKKEQDLHSIGLSWRRTLADGVPLIGQFMPTASFELKGDETKNTESAVGSITFPFLPEGCPLGTYSDLGSSWTAAPYMRMGVEWDQAYEASTPSTTGHVGRALIAAECQFFWRPEYANTEEKAKKLGREIAAPFVATVELKGWSDFTEADGRDDGDDSHFLFRAGGTLFLDAGRHFGLSLDYSHGENPTLGLAEQDFVQIGFSAIL